MLEFDSRIAGFSTGLYTRAEKRILFAKGFTYFSYLFHKAPCPSTRWLEVLLHIDESVGFTSRQKKARLTIYTFCLKSCHQNSKGTLLASSMITPTALPLRSWRAYSLEAAGHLSNTYLVSYTKLAFFQGCQWQAWHSWDTRDSAVKNIAIFVLLKNSDIHCSSGMFYLCPDHSDRTEAAWKQSLSH